MRSIGRYIVLLSHFFVAILVSAQPQGSIDAHLLPLTSDASTDAAEYGYPAFVHHFAPDDYGAQAQNWAITQDHQGVMYAANFDGILQNDGQAWRLIRTPTNAVIRSLATGREGTVYVGADGDLGHLVADSTGELQFSSLLDYVPADTVGLGDVWGTHAVREGVYFQTWKRLMRWDGDQMHTWQTDSFFHTSFSIGDRFFVNELRVGLHEMQGDSLHLVPGGAQFADKYVYTVLPIGEDALLIVTRNNGMYRLDEDGVQSISTTGSAYISNTRVYQGTLLSDGSIAIATQDAGIVLLDKEGALSGVLNTDNVLPDDVVNYVYTDRQGGLWAALDSKGLVRLDVPSALTVFREELGLQGHIRQIIRYEHSLYVGTRTGLFILQETTEGGYARFQRFPGISGSVSALALFRNALLIGTSEGVFLLQGQRLQKLSTRWAYALVVSSFHEGVVYAGGHEELFRLTFDEGAWEVTAVISLGQSVWSIFEADAESLWLGSSVAGVMRVTLSENVSDGQRIEHFNEEHGLDNTRIAIKPWNGQPIFLSQQSIFHYRPDTPGVANFRPATDLLAILDSSPGDSLQNFVQTKAGVLWASYNDHFVIANPQIGGNYIQDAPPVLHFPKLESALFIEQDGVAWISNNDVLYRYDSHVDKAYDTPFPALIRRAEVLGLGKPLYTGTAPHLLAARNLTVPPVLNYDVNDIRFNVAAPSYNNPEGTRYQYYLEGDDTQWSPWTASAERLYPNLSEGDYTLRVRAQNAQGVMSEEASFAFEVLPPWYRTMWAYAAYFFGIVMVGISSWRYQKVLQENREARLHAVALQREREANEQLVHANTRLQEANTRLEEVNERLEEVNALKDELIASVSHELRTPLTAILGFASVLKEEVDTGEHREFLQIIHDNGNRLLSTLDGLLDLAKLRAGMMEVHAEVVHVGDEAREVVRLLEHLARRKQLVLHFSCTNEPLYAALDRHLYERILFNLIGNAIKFTEEGAVTVQIARYDDQVQIEVTDTGIGISADFMPDLFAPFKQESSGFSRTHEGSGLGLTLTAELVELMKGTISVESEKGKGSTFTVTFPLYQHPMQEPALA